MLIDLICPKCLDEQTIHEKSGDPPDIAGTKIRMTSYPTELTNELVYKVDCQLGHTSLTSISLTNYEILFEHGVSAILDGFYREAVTSFAASLERFYEHSIRSIVLAQKCLPGDADKCWKEISSQSERQLGAYIYLWTIQFKETPRLLPKKMIELRNKAVHKGVIPSVDMVKEFGEEVFSIIASGQKKLWAEIIEYYMQVYQEHTRKLLDNYQKNGVEYSGVHQQIPSAFIEQTCLENHLKMMRRRHSESSIDKHNRVLSEYQ